MKKAINLIIMYFVFLILGTVFGTLLYTMFSNLLNYVAGSKLTLFSVESLFQSFFYISLCMIILICPALSFYRVRHPGGFSQAMAYIILSAFTWILLLPLDYKLISSMSENIKNEKEHTPLSKDYFRQVDGEVYYFTNDFEYTQTGALEADAIVIHSVGDNGYVNFRPVRDTPSFKLNIAAAPFREILVSENFRSKTSTSVVNFRILAGEIVNCLSAGFLHFLFYLSFALALCSIYALTNLFDWRLLNSALLFLLSALVMGFNSDFFASWLSEIAVRTDGNAVYRFLARWTSEPLVFVGNCLFTLVIMIVWIVTSAIKRHGRKGA
ncbi:MAG: hypothetical protein IJ688_03600 [Treponema sp.]|nr:hypothetical protein [Treponema sp.]